MAQLIKLVAFDLDGTLFDAYTAIYKSVNNALKDNDLPTISYQKAKKNVGWGEKKMIAALVPESKVEKVLADYREHNKKSLSKNVILFKNTKKVLKFLEKQNIKLAIATNRPTYSTEIISLT